MTEFLPLLKRWLSNLQNLITISCYGADKTKVVQELPSKNNILIERSSEKLYNMLYTLRRDIKEAFYYLPLEKPFTKHTPVTPFEKVSLNLNILDVTLKQAINLKENPDYYDSDRNDILMKCKTIISVINCLRDDVFQSYLELSTSEKLALHQKDRQMSSIFTVLGMLETEVTNFMKSLMLPSDPMFLIKPLLKTRMIRVNRRRRRLNDFNRELPASDDSSRPPKRTQNYCYYCEQRDLVDVGVDPINTELIFQERAAGESPYITPVPSSPLLKNMPNYKNFDYKNDEQITPIINQNIKFNDEFLDVIVERNNLPKIRAEEPSECSERYSSSSLITELFEHSSNNAISDRISVEKQTEKAAVNFLQKSNSSIAEINAKPLIVSPSMLQTQILCSPSLTKLSKNNSDKSLSSMDKFLSYDNVNNSDDLNVYLNHRPRTLNLGSVSLWHESANQLLSEIPK